MLKTLLSLLPRTVINAGKLTVDGQSVDEPRDARSRYSVGLAVKHDVLLLVDEFVLRRVIPPPVRQCCTHTRTCSTKFPKNFHNIFPGPS